VRVDGQSNIRQMLRTPGGDLLRSTAFTLEVSGAGSSISRLVAEGSGAGHGVGLCQWGAVGRARAGQNHLEILAAYYPGTRLERRY
jgi:stage II sporulation protein D